MADPSTVAPQESAGRRSQRDRRVEVRYPSILQAVCQPVTESFGPLTCHARVWDISATGVCLVVNRPLEPGTALVLEIETSEEKLFRPLQVQVVHTHPHMEDLWFVGCVLAEHLSDEDLHELL